MRRINISLLTFFLFSILLSAQKPPLDNNVYDGWKSLTGQIISDDGKWITYVINPQEGDGWLYLYCIISGIKDSIPWGVRAAFSPGSRYMAYQIIPSFAQTRQAKKKKLKDDKMPKNDLAIKQLTNNESVKIQRVKSFSIPGENSYWMKNGISQIEKGRINSYNLVNE